MKTVQLPAEWEPQAFVQLTWPHADTDWQPILQETYECYHHIAREISLREPLLIVAQHPEEVKEQLADILNENIHIVRCQNNDTWARDHAFITVKRITDSPCSGQPSELVLNDYQFNGWGMKFPANCDNQINHHIYDSVCQLYGRHDENRINYVNQLDFVLEGGSIESDGCGTLLTTTSCLLAPNRNDRYTQEEIEERLLHDFGAKRMLWLHHGHLDGDDTDGHIDTLARFCNPDTIAYVRCEDVNDAHYASLHLMEEELKTLRTDTGHPYRLIGLPHPTPIYDADGERLPATYANFLIINGAVLYPTYRLSELDQQAAQQLQKAFPDREMVPIDCSVLIHQHGSLHCCTMQYPK